MLLSLTHALTLTALLTAGLVQDQPQAPSAPPSVEAPVIISAEEWNSKPQPIADDKRHTPGKITLHHAGVLWVDGSDPAEKLRGLQSWGQRDKNWPDVPYHFLISPDGRIYEGRSIEYAGETNTNYDTSGHVLIHLWGNFNEQRVTLPQMASAVRLAAYLSDKYDLDPATIAGHNDVAPGQTSCPGLDFDRYIDDRTFARWVQTTLRGREPQIRIRPPLPDGPTTFPSTQPVN